MKKSLYDKSEKLIWLLLLLTAYSMISYYAGAILDTVPSGYMAHVVALFAVIILAYGIFTGRRMSK